MAGQKKEKKIHRSAVIIFCVTFLLSSILVCLTIINRREVETLRMEQIITEKSVIINETISKLLYKTESLAVLVIQGDGHIENFDKIASTLTDDPAVLNVLAAPDGVVSNVYPLRGNEKVIGLNFFSEGDGNAEAILARDTGTLVMGGPFELVQGGQALVGRLPVYIDGEYGQKVFWGLVSVTLKYPDVLDYASLNLLETQNFSYEIWRTNPDTNTRQVIAESSKLFNQNGPYIEKEIQILNAHWYFRIAPIKLWYQYLETWLLTGAGLLISFLIAFLMQNNLELRRLKTEVELLAQTDPLTGLTNRRSFMEKASSYLERSRRIGSPSYIILFDLDDFKQVNELHGRTAGDEVLRTVASRISGTLRPYDVFARYEGESFIFLLSDCTAQDALSLCDRLRGQICDRPILFEGAVISVLVSFGLARVMPGSRLDSAIQNADKALCEAKQTGRNKTVFYRQEPGV